MTSDQLLIIGLMLQAVSLPMKAPGPKLMFSLTSLAYIVAALVTS
jgi:hypothetical protein